MAKNCRPGDSVDNINMTVQLLQSADAQAEMRLAASSAGDSPYDIVHASNGFITELIAADWVMPLNDLIDKYRDEYDLDDMNIDAFADGQGNIYGIPVVVNTSHFYYNREILAAAGVEPPQTYDDVLDICATMDTDALDIDMAFGLVVFGRVGLAHRVCQHAGRIRWRHGAGQRPYAGLHRRNRRRRHEQVDGIGGRLPG